MKKIMYSLDETANLIRSGRFLALAADEAVLRQLPIGNWIGGTIPYFMGEQGGFASRELVHVTDLGAAGCGARIVEYDAATLPGIAADAPENGYTVLILPAQSPLHLAFAGHAEEYEDLFLKPLVGWIAGVHLDDLATTSPRVFNGLTGQGSLGAGVALHLPLPAGQVAVVRILNLFRQGQGDVLSFPRGGFAVTDCRVNGKAANFAQYVREAGLDTARPLVADYNGAQINVSFQSVDLERGRVQFYAPVFADIEYRHAAPVGDYVQEFDLQIAAHPAQAAFSCNCILNYLYGELEGKHTGEFTGPMTFGEIGYALLNQTLVYLEVVANG
jgi:hypothetical protein